MKMPSQSPSVLLLINLPVHFFRLLREYFCLPASLLQHSVQRFLTEISAHLVHPNAAPLHQKHTDI